PDAAGHMRRPAWVRLLRRRRHPRRALCTGLETHHDGLEPRGIRFASYQTLVDEGVGFWEVGGHTSACGWVCDESKRIGSAFFALEHREGIDEVSDMTSCFGQVIRVDEDDTSPSGDAPVTVV